MPATVACGADKCGVGANAGVTKVGGIAVVTGRRATCCLDGEAEWLVEEVGGVVEVVEVVEVDAVDETEALGTVFMSATPVVRFEILDAANDTQPIPKTQYRVCVGIEAGSRLTENTHTLYAISRGCWKAATGAKPVGR